MAEASVSGLESFSLLSMSTEEERLEQLRQAGFVDVDKWSKTWFDEDKQQRLLDVLRNDPQAHSLK